MNKRLLITLPAAALTLTVHQAGAALIMDWTDPGTQDATTVGTGYNTSTVTLGDGLNFDGDNGSAQGYYTAKWQNSPNDPDGSSNDDNYPTDLATSITRDIYWSFSISKTDSSAFDIASVDIGELNTRDSANDFNYYLLSDVGGFSNTAVLAQVQDGNPLSWSATGTDFNSLTSVEFRIYLTGDSADYKENSIGIEGDGLSDLSVTAVPEPATFALMFGAFALGLVMWRRRVR